MLFHILYYYRDHPNSDAKTKNLFYIDETNVQSIKEIIISNPEKFSECYESLHRLMRWQSTERSATQELNKTKRDLIKAQQELGLIKNSALFSIGKKFGLVASKSHPVDKILRMSGKIVKKIIGD